MAVEWLQREREFGLQFPDKGLFSPQGRQMGGILYGIPADIGMVT